MAGAARSVLSLPSPRGGPMLLTRAAGTGKPAAATASARPWLGAGIDECIDTRQVGPSGHSGDVQCHRDLRFGRGSEADRVIRDRDLMRPCAAACKASAAPRPNPGAPMPPEHESLKIRHGGRPRSARRNWHRRLRSARKFGQARGGDKGQFNKRISRSVADGFELLAIHSHRKVPDLLAEALILLQERHGKV
jgi:hypothetical protein